MTEGARSLLDSAGQAFASGDVAAAAAAVDAALELEDLPDARRLLAGLRLLDDRLEDCRHEYERAFRAYRDQGDRCAAARMALELAELHDGSLGNPAAGRGWIERARRLLTQVGHCVEWGYLELAIMACNRDDIVDLEASADRALAIAIEFGDHGLEVRALADGGLALVTAGRVRDGFRRLDEAMAAITGGEVQDRMAAGSCFCSMLSSCDRVGDVARAEEWIRIVRELMVDPLGGRPVIMQMHCLLAYGSVLSGAGRWQEAEAVLLDALGPNGSRSSGHRGEASARLAALRIDQGRLEQAAQLLAPYEDRVCACEPLARLHLARNEPGLAVAVSRRGLKQLRGDALRTAPLLAVLVESELRAGSIDGAEQAAADLTRTAAAAQAPILAAEAALARGRVAMARSDAGAAIDCFDAAIDQLRGDERPARRGEVHLALAGALAARGDAPGAIAEARAAMAIFERLGASARINQAAAQLRTLGVPVRARVQDPAALVGSLSARETEVLDLLSEGLTNAEIAGRLFISPKTAEHHVGRVLAKLGARSRAEAAAIAATRGVDPK